MQKKKKTHMPDEELACAVWTKALCHTCVKDRVYSEQLFIIYSIKYVGKISMHTNDSAVNHVIASICLC